MSKIKDWRMEGDGCGKEQGFRDWTMNYNLIFTNTTQCKFFSCTLKSLEEGSLIDMILE